MISEASQIDSKRIEGLDHVLALKLSGKQGWWKSISTEQSECIWVGISVPVEKGLEASHTSFGLLFLGLNVINVIEVKDRKEFFVFHNNFEAIIQKIIRRTNFSTKASIWWYKFGFGLS